MSMEYKIKICQKYYNSYNGWNKQGGSPRKRRRDEVEDDFKIMETKKKQAMARTFGKGGKFI